MMIDYVYIKDYIDGTKIYQAKPKPSFILCKIKVLETHGRKKH